MSDKFTMKEKYEKDVEMLMSLVSGSDGEGPESTLEGMDSMIYALEAEDIAGREVMGSGMRLKDLEAEA